MWLFFPLTTSCLANLKCHRPPSCSSVRCSATLSRQTRLSRCQQSLLAAAACCFCYSLSLSPISIYISGLIIRPDIYSVRSAPGNASVWHPRGVHGKQGREEVALFVHLSVVSIKKKQTNLCRIRPHSSWALNTPEPGISPFDAFSRPISSPLCL